jgi:hypothetical protein
MRQGSGHEGNGEPGKRRAGDAETGGGRREAKGQQAASSRQQAVSSAEEPGCRAAEMGKRRDGEAAQRKKSGEVQSLPNGRLHSSEIRAGK